MVRVRGRQANSLCSWRYCLGAWLKFWRRSRDPKKGSEDEAFEILFLAAYAAKFHSTSTQYRQLRRLADSPWVLRSCFRCQAGSGGDRNNCGARKWSTAGQKRRKRKICCFYKGEFISRRDVGHLRFVPPPCIICVCPFRNFHIRVSLPISHSIFFLSRLLHQAKWKFDRAP